jgi:hypothetical protein
MTEELSTLLNLRGMNRGNVVWMVVPMVYGLLSPALGPSARVRDVRRVGVACLRARVHRFLMPLALNRYCGDGDGLSSWTIH